MAKKEELTVEEKLQALYTLQTFDSSIDGIHKLRGELPIEVSDLEDEIVGLTNRVEKLEKDMTRFNEQITKNEHKIKESSDLILRYESQQNNVRNNREFDAITKEIELQHLEIQLCEKKINDAKSSIEGGQSYLEESKAKLESRISDLEIKKNDLDKIYSDTEAEETKLLKKAEKSKKKIEDRLLTAYERVRKTYRNGLAVAKVDRDACGGCFAKVPPQKMLEISQRKKIIICEHCGRILIDKELEALKIRG